MLDFGFYNMDCMEGMKEFPDKYFDLAVVDPPYGDAMGGRQTDLDSGSTDTRRRGGRHGQGRNCRQPDGTWGYASWRNMGDEICKKIIAWDIAPKQEYFTELFRVSRNQIIWGGQLFRASCYTVFPDMAKNDDFGIIQHGDGGICVDFI